MVHFETIRVAAVQATPVILDAEGSVDKAVALIGEAAAQGAQLVVLPEVFDAVGHYGRTDVLPTPGGQPGIT